ncbi:alpha/beta fold hydrolase [Nannocystis pusilla]|uniref:alpha/beta fold hydrolase n=1 Tax=Nannocystis pusilla TaxID=889268 RepID=UPI003B7756D8
MAAQREEDLDDPATVESIVRGILRQVTGRNDDDIDAGRELKDMGVDSLMNIHMMRKAEQAFGVEMSIRALSQTKTAGGPLTIRWFVDQILALRRGVGGDPEATQESADVAVVAERVEHDAASLASHQALLGARIPIETSTITLSSGARIEVLCAGTGAPLVLLCPIMASIPVWVCQIEAFWRDHRVIALNYPGYGRSTDTPAAMSPGALARLLAVVLDALGVHEAVHLVGWSMGGMIAQEFGLSWPQRVRSIALVSTTSHLEEADTIANMEDLFRGLREDLERDTPEPAMVARRKRALDMSRREAGPERSFGYMAEVLRFDVRQRIRGLRPPTLVVQGLEDTLAAPRHGRYMWQEIPGAEHHGFAACGHFAPLHVPSAFNELLRDFVRRCSSSDPPDQ